MQNLNFLYTVGKVPGKHRKVPFLLRQLWLVLVVKLKLTATSVFQVDGYPHSQKVG